MWKSLSRWWDRLQEAEHPLGPSGDNHADHPARHRFVGYRTLGRLHGANWDRLLTERQAEIHQKINDLLAPIGGWVRGDAHGLVLHFPQDGLDDDTLDRQAELARAALFELLSPPPGAIPPPETITPAPERRPPIPAPIMAPIAPIAPPAPVATPVVAAPEDRGTGLGGFLSGLKRPDPPAPPKRLAPPVASPVPVVASLTLPVQPPPPPNLIVPAPGEIPVAARIVSSFEGLDRAVAPPPAPVAPDMPLAAPVASEEPPAGAALEPEPEQEPEPQPEPPPPASVAPAVTLPPRVRKVAVAQIPSGMSFDDLWDDLVGPMPQPAPEIDPPAPQNPDAAEPEIGAGDSPEVAPPQPEPLITPLIADTTMVDPLNSAAEPVSVPAPTPPAEDPPRPRHARIRKVAVPQLPPGISFADAWRDLVGEDLPPAAIATTEIVEPIEPVKPIVEPAIVAAPIPLAVPPVSEPPRRSLDDIWSDLMGAAASETADRATPAPVSSPEPSPTPVAPTAESSIFVPTGDGVRSAPPDAPLVAITDKPWFGPAYVEQTPLDATTRALQAADEAEMEKIIAAPVFSIRRRRFEAPGPDGIAVGYRSFWGAGNGLVATYLVHPLKVEEASCRSAFELAEQAQSAKASADLDLLMLDRVGPAITEAIRHGKRFIPVLPISKSTLLRHRLRGPYLQRWHAQSEETRTVTRFVIWEVDHSTSRGELQEMAGLLRQFGKPPLIRLNPASTVAGRMQGAGYSYVFYDLAEPHLPEERSWLMQRLPQITAKFRQNNLRVMIGGADDVPTIKQIFQAKPDLIEAGDIANLEQLPDMPRHLTPPALATQILAEFGRSKAAPPESTDQAD